MHGGAPLWLMLLIVLLPAALLGLAIWWATRALGPTARPFLRLVAFAALCTPVPVVNEYGVWLPGYFVASFLLPSATKPNGTLLTYAIAVSITCVLGAMLLVLRTALRTHDLRRR
jgi:hypothetical protein